MFPVLRVERGRRMRVVTSFFGRIRRDEAKSGALSSLFYHPFSHIYHRFAPFIMFHLVSKPR